MKMVPVDSIVFYGGNYPELDREPDRQLGESDCMGRMGPDKKFKGKRETESKVLSLKAWEYA